MRNSRRIPNAFRFVSVGLAGLGGFATAASAGGFAIGEQSTVFMGTASAGNAAGGSIGSMYWNPAAAASLPGINTESSYTLILGHSTSTVTNFDASALHQYSGPIPPGTPGNSSGNVGIDSVTGASYGTYQYSNDLWLGMSLSSPFGLATKPDNPNYLGSAVGVTTKLTTIDATPTIAYRIAPGITIGAGVQIMWAQGKLQFNETPGSAPSIAQFGGTDWAFGGTAGITIEPARGTTIGVGYRSGMDLNLGGSFHQPAIPMLAANANYSATGSLKLPDLVTASFRQEISPVTRLLGTVEWTNWSRFQSLDLVADGLGARTVPANWSDDWFFSLGGEYDYSHALTLRTGVAYELSPEDGAAERFTTIPDNNRVWLNFGASYKWSESLTFDVAYSHIFVQDGAFTQTSPLLPITVGGTQQSSADLISVGMRTVW